MPAPNRRLPAYFGMRHRTAAQHRDVGFRIEDRGIHCNFHLVERGAVFGVEEALVLRGDHGRLAAPFDADFAEVECAIGIELF